MSRPKHNHVLPGFKLTMGFTLVYVIALVVIPLSTLFFKTASLSWNEFVTAVTSARVVASYKLSLTSSLCAASVNAVFGLLIAWVLVRYRFWGQGLIDMLIDLPFALPTAVAGIALTTAFSESGIIGAVLAKLGIKIAYTQAGIIVAMIFIGLPFVVRAVQPVLADLDHDMEEAALSLGASGFQTFLYVIFPGVFPAIISGFAMAFARALGEYGSVIFIAGNLPMKTEITPLIIMGKLEQYDYAGATAVAAVMLMASFILLYLINEIHNWSHARHSKGSKA